MEFSPRLDKIGSSMTLEINSRSKKMGLEGIKVISLAVGEPDFNTPDYIKKAAILAIEENFTKYTQVAGIPELRKAAAEYFNRNYEEDIQSNSIIIGAGGKQCIFEFFQTMMRPNEEVLIPSPYWVSYPPIVELSGGIPIIVKTDIENCYKIHPQLLEKYKTEKTKFLILNNPSNPTGIVYTHSELEEIIKWAFANNIYVLSDEIYDQLVYNPARMISAIKWYSKNPDFICVVNGLSKSFAMTGWRVGFLCASPEIIKKMEIFQGHSLSNVCSIAQKAGLAALDGSYEFPEFMRDTFVKRRNLAVSIIKKWEKAKFIIPDGAFYIFIDIHRYYNNYIDNSLKFCLSLLEKFHVALVPGSAFGDDNCIRISYAVNEERLTEALNKLGQFLQSM